VPMCLVDLIDNGRIARPQRDLGIATQQRCERSAPGAAADNHNMCPLF